MQSEAAAALHTQELLSKTSNCADMYELQQCYSTRQFDGLFVIMDRGAWSMILTQGRHSLPI